METITSKIVICGDFGVGKTTLVKLFLGGKVLEGYKPTIGVDIGRKILDIDQSKMILQIWDLSGQQTFQSIRRQFYSRTDGAVLVFDVSRRETYQNISHWIVELLEQAGKVPIVLVGNKIDLRKQLTESVTTDEGESLSEDISKKTGEIAPFVEASALMQQNNLEPFILLGKSIFERSRG